jgi:hypothetical protein
MVVLQGHRGTGRGVGAPARAPREHDAREDGHNGAGHDQCATCAYAIAVLEGGAQLTVIGRRDPATTACPEGSAYEEEILADATGHADETVI